MKINSKILNFILIVTSLIGYLEWSGDSSTFLFQAEWEIIYKIFTNPTSVLHPFIVLPMIGQLILVYTLFQSKPSKLLTYISLCSLGLLLGFMFFIGILSLNYKIIGSTIPFVITSVTTILYYKKTKNIENKNSEVN